MGSTVSLVQKYPELAPVLNGQETLTSAERATILTAHPEFEPYLDKYYPIAP